jgi:hypothetical protein
LVKQTPGTAEPEADQSAAAANALTAKSSEGNAGPQSLVDLYGLTLVARPDLRATGE